jgi:hypothetical protein
MRRTLVQDRYIEEMARLLNQCLIMLDELGMCAAATHLSTAIEALPGQSALPPQEVLDLID